MEDYIESNMLFDRYHQINEYKYVEHEKKNIENKEIARVFTPPKGASNEFKPSIVFKNNLNEPQLNQSEQKQKNLIIDNNN